MDSQLNARPAAELSTDTVGGSIAGSNIIIDADIYLHLPDGQLARLIAGQLIVPAAKVQSTLLMIASPTGAVRLVWPRGLGAPAW